MGILTIVGILFQGRCQGQSSVIVTITDSCPECGADHLDLQALTFDKV
jgi:hypothetical protein